MNAGADVAARLGELRERVAGAAAESGRDPAAVRIVAVSKKQDAGAVREAYAAGQRDFGENYVQEAVAKMASLGGSVPGARWHFVGRLQSNKAATAVRRFSLLHGVDSLRTVSALSRAAVVEGRVAEVLLQVRLGRSAGAARGGVEPDAARAFLEEAGAFAAVRFAGLMGVADPGSPARPQFAALRELSDRLRAPGLAHAPLGELSMGMTGDFEDAIREGATIVRIGTAIFGQRPAA